MLTIKDSHLKRLTSGVRQYINPEAPGQALLKPIENDEDHLGISFLFSTEIQKPKTLLWESSFSLADRIFVLFYVSVPLFPPRFPDLASSHLHIFASSHLRISYRITHQDYCINGYFYRYWFGGALAFVLLAGSYLKHLILLFNHSSLLSWCFCYFVSFNKQL